MSRYITYILTLIAVCWSLGASIYLFTEGFIVNGTALVALNTIAILFIFILIVEERDRY